MNDTLTRSLPNMGMEMYSQQAINGHEQHSPSTKMQTLSYTDKEAVNVLLWNTTTALRDRDCYCVLHTKVYLLTYLLTCILTYLLTYLLTHLPTLILTCMLTYVLTYLLATYLYLVSYLLTNSLTRLLTYLLATHLRSYLLRTY